MILSHRSSINMSLCFSHNPCFFFFFSFFFVRSFIDEKKKIKIVIRPNIAQKIHHNTVPNAQCFPLSPLIPCYIIYVLIGVCVNIRVCMCARVCVAHSVFVNAAGCGVCLCRVSWFRMVWRVNKRSYMLAPCTHTFNVYNNMV